MKRRIRRSLISMVSLIVMLATLIIPGISVAAASDPGVSSIEMELTATQTYQRPLYPPDTDMGGDSSETYWTDAILEANTYYEYPQSLIGDFSYQTYAWTASETGWYTFTVQGEILAYSGNDGLVPDDGNRDLMFWLYAGSFSPADALAHVLAVNDSGDNSITGYPLYPRLEVELTAGTTYVLVTTTYWPETTGSVTVAIEAPSGSSDPSDPADAGSDSKETPTEEAPPLGASETIEAIEEAVGSLAESTTDVLPVKRDPITILQSATRVRTEDLGYFAAIPEQWMRDVTYVEFWVDAIPLAADSPRQTDVARAVAALQTAGKTLHQTCEVSLMSRVTWQDRHQVIRPLAPSEIRANIPIYLPVPDDLAMTADLGIAWIDDAGAVAFLDSVVVQIDGVNYLQFENNQLPAVYAYVS